MLSFQMGQRRKFKHSRFIAMRWSIQPGSGRADMRFRMGRGLCELMGWRRGQNLLVQWVPSRRSLAMWFPHPAIALRPTWELSIPSSFSEREFDAGRLLFRKTVDRDALTDSLIDPDRSMFCDLIACQFPGVMPGVVLEIAVPAEAAPAWTTNPGGNPPRENGSDPDVRNLCDAMQRFIDAADPVLIASTESPDSFDAVWCRIAEQADASGVLLQRFATRASRMVSDMIAFTNGGNKR